MILNKRFCFHSKHTCLEVRTSSLFKKVQSMSTSVPPLFILTLTCSDAFHWMLHKTMFYFVMHKTTKDDQQFTTKNQQNHLIMLPKGGKHIGVALSVCPVSCPANSFKTTDGI